MTTQSPKTIEIWSDIACPWCWVGKKHIEEAIAQFGSEVKVHWRAFELNPQAPTTPAQPVDYAERLASKYGMSRQEAQAFIDRMTAAGREKGIEFRFDRIRPTNTFNAHRLLSWAATFDRQDALKERLFRAYMNEGLDLNDHNTLHDLAADVGLDGEEALSVLISDAHRTEVLADKARAGQLGINGVPFFVFAPGVTASGAQPPDILRNALAHAHSLEAPSGSCTTDGCTA